MSSKFEIIFDDVMLKRLKKLGKNQELKNRISKMLDRIEEMGPRAGKLLDSNLSCSVNYDRLHHHDKKIFFLFG